MGLRRPSPVYSGSADSLVILCCSLAPAAPGRAQPPSLGRVQGDGHPGRGLERALARLTQRAPDWTEPRAILPFRTGRRAQGSRAIQASRRVRFCESRSRLEAPGRRPAPQRAAPSDTRQGVAEGPSNALLPSDQFNSLSRRNTHWASRHTPSYTQHSRPLQEFCRGCFAIAKASKYLLDA